LLRKARSQFVGQQFDWSRDFAPQTFSKANLESSSCSLMPTNRAPSVQSDPMPDEHQDGVPRAAALSIEAMVRDHESTAKEIEAMGAELISAAKKCEAMTAEVHNAIAYMRDTAAAYRKEAKKIFKRIEDCALFAEDVRKTCETLKRRIETGDLRADTKVIDLPDPLRRAN
jgi:hypothetical protein